MHTSIKLETPCEFINIKPVNPLISKCQIKVCYVGDQPNRNGSIITKEVAMEMANSLPGSPIVGYFNEIEGDFEEHNRSIDISNGRFEIKDTTKPYGFVDLNAKCWFQEYEDDGVKHEYLCTEGWLWTGQYPECQRVVERGNNQSMELDEKTLKAQWAKNNNGDPQFFIINEAIISKLCILGEEVEPCFEGSSITKVQFSFEDSFKQQLFSMMTELKKLLNEGGSHVATTYSVTVGDSLWNALYNHVQEISDSLRIDSVFEEEGQKFAVLHDGEKYSRLDFSMDEENGFVPADQMTELEDFVPAEAPQFSLEDVEAFESEFKKKDEKEEDKSEQEDTSESENKEDEDKKSDSEEDDEDEKKKKEYSLDEIPEYIDLKNQYAELQEQFDSLNQELNSLKSEHASLVEFKKASERKEKEAMIASFYMLTEEDKANVIENIDTYSLKDIEAELSIICVRNKVSFNLEENEENKAPNVYNLDAHEMEDSMPAWVKAVLDTEKNLKN